jgi:hypothetical protein
MKTNLEMLRKLFKDDKLQGQFDVSNDDYHAAPGISSTFLIDCAEYSVAHAKAWKENPQPASKAMQFGTLVHMAILEPDLLNQYYRVVPSTDMRTKEGKACVELARLEGVIAITQETLDKTKAIRQSLLSTQTGRSLFDGGYAEQSFFGTDPTTELLVKAKADYINPKYKLLLDIKKTSDGRLWNIKKSIYDYGYRIQAAFYPDVINLAMKQELVTDVIWVFIEESYPHGVRFIEVKKEWREIGAELYKNALQKYNQAIETGVFPGYEDQIISIDEKDGAQ